MRFTVLLVVTTALAAYAAGAQSFHPPDYIVGGGLPSSGPETKGLNRLDMTGSVPALTKWLQPGMQCRCVTDRDNRQILVSVQGNTTSNSLFQGVRGGLFRFDPATLTVKTIYKPSESPVTGFTSFFHTEIDYNGHYIAGAYVNDLQKPQNRGYRLLKVGYYGSPQLILATTRLGRKADLGGKITTDIQTGLVLIADLTSVFSPTTVHFPILAMDTVSTAVSTYNTGGVYGWYGGYSLPQNYRTGDIEGPWGTRVLRVTRGTGSRTTVTVLPGLPYPMYGGGDFDLQTAYRPRYICMGFQNAPPRTWVYQLDSQNWNVTAIQALSTVKTDSLSFDFYRGRHTQGILNGKQRWDVYLSAPHHPNKPYVAAIGASGVWPGIKIPDGRRFLLNLDNVVILSAQNLMRPYFDQGPGTLDKNGNAKAHINLSAFSRFGVPLWFTWAVLDPAAPSGVAYIPNPYVLRI